MKSPLAQSSNRGLSSFEIGGRKMTVNEALANIETVSRCTNQPVLQEEISCADTQRALELLANAYEHIRNRDPLYGDRRRRRLPGPPPGSVPPS